MAFYYPMPKLYINSLALPPLQVQDMLENEFFIGCYKVKHEMHCDTENVMRRTPIICSVIVECDSPSELSMPCDVCCLQNGESIRTTKYTDSVSPDFCTPGRDSVELWERRILYCVPVTTPILAQLLHNPSFR